MGYKLSGITKNKNVRMNNIRNHKKINASLNHQIRHPVAGSRRLIYQYELIPTIIVNQTGRRIDRKRRSPDNQDVRFADMGEKRETESGHNPEY